MKLHSLQLFIVKFWIQCYIVTLLLLYFLYTICMARYISSIADILGLLHLAKMVIWIFSSSCVTQCNASIKFAAIPDVNSIRRLLTTGNYCYFVDIFTWLAKVVFVIGQTLHPSREYVRHTPKEVVYYGIMYLVVLVMVRMTSEGCSSNANLSLYEMCSKDSTTQYSRFEG